MCYNLVFTQIQATVILMIWRSRYENSTLKVVRDLSIRCRFLRCQLKKQKYRWKYPELLVIRVKIRNYMIKYVTQPSFILPAFQDPTTSPTPPCSKNRIYLVNYVIQLGFTQTDSETLRL